MRFLTFFCFIVGDFLSKFFLFDEILLVDEEILLVGHQRVDQGVISFDSGLVGFSLEHPLLPFFKFLRLLYLAIDSSQSRHFLAVLTSW